MFPEDPTNLPAALPAASMATSATEGAPDPNAPLLNMALQQPMPLQQPIQPQTPPMNLGDLTGLAKALSDTRRSHTKDRLTDALATFVFSLGQGMSAAGQVPGGSRFNAQRNAAAMGGALQGTQILQQMRQQQLAQQQKLAIEQQLAQAQLNRAQTPPQRNIDPLSDQGIAADVRKQRMLTGSNPLPAPHTIPDGKGGTLQWDAASSKWVPIPGTGGAPPKVPDMTPEEKFTDLYLKDASSKKGGNLNTGEEILARKDARKQWGELNKDPTLEALNLQMKELQIKLQQDALAKKNNNELSTADNRRVDAVIQQFNNNGVVKDYVDRQNKYESMKAIMARPWSGPGDLALVYAFMKALDPTSVVRESEYDAAAKSGNIFAGWAAKFNGQLNPKGGFLAPQVRDDFLGLTKTQLDVTAKQYNQIRRDFASRINRIAKEDVGESWLPNYGGAFNEPAQAAPPKAPAVKNPFRKS